MSKIYLKRQLREYADTFYQIRREKKLSLADLGKISHINPEVIEKIELGKIDFPFSVMIYLCKLYKKRMLIEIVDD